ncbi:5-methylcytosine restriction system specificity protein McrC [Burkholderia gladioli]|uniref:5-methylcytosine restriction system specificity protein McrC n=1 Tax=Burkholderia gladioli TaxID=28095 RepID=UPI0016402092|nr:hypothetical protein [Burkholderia gladioli]
MGATKIIPIEEFETIPLPIEAMGPNGELIVYPDVLKDDYFTIRAKKGSLVLQAGSRIGIIPVNSNLHLNVRPKVPLSNLERVIFLSNHQPESLRQYEREYDSHRYRAASVEDFLIDAFLNRVEDIHDNGLLKTYRKEVSNGSFPRGTIDFHKTMQHQARGRLAVGSARYVRHVDNGPNRLIKYVLALLLSRLSGSKHKKQRGRVLTQLAYFDGVSDDIQQKFLSEASVLDPSVIVGTRQYYGAAIALALTILSGSGISFLSAQSKFEMGTLLLNLGDAFEEYVRYCLSVINEESASLRVFDGNKSGEDGARKKLLDKLADTLSVGADTPATPDVVIEHYSPPFRPSTLVIEVKYKRIEALVSREDLNQLIAYVASYGANAGVFILPSHSARQRGLVALGSIANVPIYQYFFNLDAVDIVGEERRLRETVQGLAIPPSIGGPPNNAPFS